MLKYLPHDDYFDLCLIKCMTPFIIIHENDSEESESMGYVWGIHGK